MKDYQVFLKHIIESIGFIRQFIKGKSKEDFEKSVQLQDAVIRRLEVIGEAVKNIDENFKEKNKNIEWKKIAGMRDVIIHRYFGIDLDLVWVTINEDLVKLEKEMLKIIK